jgi:hypothetical protein
MERRTADDFRAEIDARQVDRGDGLSQDNPSTDHDIIITAAQEAARRLLSGQSWQDWRKVGSAAQILRGRAMLEAGTNKPEGKLYAAAFGRLLADAKLDKLLGGNEHKALRCRLLELMDHINEVDVWWARLAANNRVEWNYPLTIYKHWQRLKAPTAPPADKPLSPVAKLKESIAALSEENLRLKEANGCSTISARDSARDVVTVLRGMFSARKLEEIRSLLDKEIKR